MKNFKETYGNKLFWINKRIFDIILCLLLLFLLFITAIILLVLNPFLNPGSLLFIQKRMGKNCEFFFAIKFRTMFHAMEITRKYDEPIETYRITPLGKILRKMRIDELPQILNVLKGDMAIVGPRPHMTDHTKYYSKEVKNFMQRHKCLPGITGWAQVNGSRGPTTEEGAMKKRYTHDLYYIKNWNLMLDLYILIRTIFVVLFQRVD